MQILVANLDYSDYLGRLAIARVFNGKMFTGEDVAIAKLDGTLHKTEDYEAVLLLRPEADRYYRDGIGGHRRGCRGRGDHDWRDDYRR